jgi:hypothetical protein
MLTYHPAFDLYNATFRILRLLDPLNGEALELDRLRILDFYLLFPFLLGGIEFPAAAIKYKKHFVKKPSEYENISDPKRLFMRLEPYQLAALQCLAAYSLIDPIALKEEVVKRTSTALPPELQKAIDLRNRESIEIDLLSGPFAKADLYGASGLKFKSDLFEYRYDPK